MYFPTHLRGDFPSVTFFRTFCGGPYPNPNTTLVRGHDVSTSHAFTSTRHSTLTYRTIEMELAPHPVIPKKKPVLVCILDGWGENKIKDEYNACHVAKSPTMDALAAKGPDYYRTVLAHGPAVGLPTEQDMGNSEVCHADTTSSLTRAISALPQDNLFPSPILGD